MRKAQFIPRQEGNSWRVSIPAQYSPTGKRQNLLFETKAQAQQEVNLIRRRKSSFGQMLHEITPHELSEAVRAMELLRPHKVGLLEAVTAFVGDLEKRANAKTFGQAFDAYEALRTRSRDYHKELEHARANVQYLLGRPVTDIQASDLEAALSGYAASTRDARIRRLRSVFNEAVRQGWVSFNVADRMNTVGKRRDEVRIYAVADVERLLRAAMERDRSLVPFLAIAAFCGLRPENELFNLDWSDVHLDDPNPQIVIRPETSKTRRRRFVDVSANCIAWIRAAGAELSGRVVPFSASTLKRKRVAVCGALGIEWIPDGFRHSYCSAHIARHADVNKLLIQTGHSNAGVLWRHYYRVMSAADAAAYWEIRPE